MSAPLFDMAPDAMGASLADPMGASGVSRLAHLVELHRAGHFDPTAGPASSAMAARLAQHAMDGMDDPTAGGLTPALAAPATPSLSPSGQVPVSNVDMGSQKPGASFLDQFATGLSEQNMPKPTGYQSPMEQFLTTLLGTGLKTFASAQTHEMSDKQRLTDALEARTADMNRRNLDLQDRKALLATEHGYRTGETAAQIAGQAKAKSDADAADQRAVPASLARMLGQPELAGQKFPSNVYEGFVRAAAGIREAGIRASSGGGSGGGSSASETRQQALRRSILNDRASRMLAANESDRKTAESMGSSKADKAEARARIAKRNADLEGVYAKMVSLEDEISGDGGTPSGITVRAGGANPVSAESPVADHTAEIASLRAEAKRVNQEMNASGALSGDRRSQATRRMAQIEGRMRQLGTSLNAVSGIESTPDGARQLGRDSGATPPAKVPVLGPNNEKGMALPGQQLQGGWRYV